MSIRSRIIRGAAVVAIAGSSAFALAPAAHAAVPPGPGDITNPTKCTHGCGGGGGGLVGPGDLTSNPDGPIVVGQPTFTG